MKIYQQDSTYRLFLLQSSYITVQKNILNFSRNAHYNYSTRGSTIILHLLVYPTLIPRNFFHRFPEIHLSPPAAGGWRGKRADEFNGTESGPISASSGCACMVPRFGSISIATGLLWRRIFPTGFDRHEGEDKCVSDERKWKIQRDERVKRSFDLR